MTSLTVLCPNAHRCKISTTPGKLLQEILEEACMRQGYDSTKYGLQSQRKFVDLSLPIRLCGLPNNATLELIKREALVGSDTNVQVAVQGEFGRHMRDFPASTSLAQILETFSPLTEIDLLCKSDELLIPTIGYMNKMYKGIENLSRNTLKSIGIETGRALFRYSQLRVTPDELQQMRAQIEVEEANRRKLMELYIKNKEENEQRELLDRKYQEAVNEREKQRIQEQKRLAESQAKEEPSEPTISHPSRLNQLQNALNTVSASLTGGIMDNLVDQMLADDGHLRIGHSVNIQPVENVPVTDFKFPAVPIATFEQLMVEDSKSNELEIAIPDRQPVIFERKREEVIEDEPDEFFEVTVAEAKLMQRELSEKVQISQQALLPKSFIDKRNKEIKSQAYQRCVIRIRFEETIFVQAQFLSNEPVDRLFNFVSDILNSNAPDFSLSQMLNQKLERSKTLDMIDAGLAPDAIINIHFRGSKASRNFIDQSKIRECTNDEADEMSHEWLSINTAFKPETFTVQGESETQLKKRIREDPYPSSSINKSPSSDPKPKWLKRL